MPTFELVDPPMRGVPQPRYFTPQVRVNGMTQDAGFDWKLNPCFIDSAAIVAEVLAGVNQAPNQTLAIAGNQLSISGGNSVTLPAVVGVSFAVADAPTIAQDAPIPSDQVGTDAYLLGAPAVWLQVNIAGTPYVVPGYASVFPD